MKEILTEEKKRRIDKEFMEELRLQVDELKNAGRYKDARDVLKPALREFKDHLWLNTLMALFYYMDDTLPMEERVSSALERLVAVDMAEPGEKEDGEDRMLRGFAAAFFTLEEYEQAGQLMAMLPERMPPESLAAFMDHLIRVAYRQGAAMPETAEQIDASPAWQTLKPFLSENPLARLVRHRGKTGLALSGGGFRASLYHLGVLARLAEIDVLRQVEVISTVSGGSLVGVLYYLKLKHLLETKPDADILRSDYIQIVRETQNVFLTGIQENIRVLAFAGFLPNFKMIFSSQYNRSHRLGELFETILYKNALPGFEDSRPIFMDDLYIRPFGETTFSPRTGNWRRQAKVPILLINAANLNTGHPWRFTVGFMGEPPGPPASKTDSDKLIKMDKNARYRRVRYQDAPEPHQRYRLGHAVAASACMPGIFPPLTIKGLYPGKTVRLVDGGVHDNQGATGLLDEGCSMLFVSDASGQTHNQDHPSDNILSLLLRSSSITIDRVREKQYQELRARLAGNRLRGLFFVHLKKDFPPALENWIGCQEPAGRIDEAGELPYGITLLLQNKIAQIRTDLDAFTDVEAHSLMASGYLMAKQEAGAILERCRQFDQTEKWAGVDLDAPGEEAGWPFLSLAGYLDAKTDSPNIRKDLARQLGVAACRAFKAWRLDNLLQACGGMMILLILAMMGLVVQVNWGTVFQFTVGGAIVFVAFAGLLMFMIRKLPIEKSLQSIARDAFIAFVGSFAARFHLDIVNPAFRERGSFERLLNQERRASRLPAIISGRSGKK